MEIWGMVQLLSFLSRFLELWQLMNIMLSFLLYLIVGTI